MILPKAAKRPLRRLTLSGLVALTTSMNSAKYCSTSLMSSFVILISRVLTVVPPAAKVIKIGTAEKSVIPVKKIVTVSYYSAHDSSLLMSSLVAMLGALGLKGGIVGKADGNGRVSASVMFTGTIRTVRSVAMLVSSCTAGRITSALSKLE